MSPEAVSAERVYLDLKAEILRGRFPAGTVLNVHSIAEEHEMSISPVRDALQRMVGERIVELRAGGGFQMPVPAEDEARDLYLWNDRLLRMAVRGGFRFRAPGLEQQINILSDDDHAGLVAVTCELFYRIGECAGSVEHLLAIRSASERLYPLRRAESLLSSRTAELQRLWNIAKSDRSAAFRSAIEVLASAVVV